MTTKRSSPTRITERFIDGVIERLAANKPVRRKLPVWGRVHIDRQLPFLCVYRRPMEGNDAGTERLVMSEASYLIASKSPKLDQGLKALILGIAETLGKEFGSFLLVEVWSAPGTRDNGGSAPLNLTPQFQVSLARRTDAGSIIDTLDSALARIKVRKKAAQVIVTRNGREYPPNTAPLIESKLVTARGWNVVGVEVTPVFRDPTSGTVYPQVLRELRREFSRALRRAFYEFACEKTTHRPRHYHGLGRRAMVKAVWEVDKRLAGVSSSFDLLLQVTPANAAAAWKAFERSRCARVPVFHYRPFTADPVVLKRKLYSARVERVEDPAIALLFRQKIDETDRKITMLGDINTKRFVHASVQLYGGVDSQLRSMAEKILDVLPSRTRDDTRAGYLEVTEFARRAEAEVEYYRQQWPEVAGRVTIRDDIASGLMVSSGSLLIGRDTRVPAARAEALLNHEIGTHILTYYNGMAQPFRQLYAGLAGYDALQEGLAVVAEYMVGGLSRPRMRLLAARVVATDMMLNGATFMETFRELDRAHDFAKRTAFTVTMRIYRGGGLTKDAVYLRGLAELLRYLGNGGSLQPLYVGKIAAEHIPIVKELQWRRVLRKPPLTPRYLDKPEASARLERLRSGLAPLDLVTERQ